MCDHCFAGPDGEDDDEFRGDGPYDRHYWEEIDDGPSGLGVMAHLAAEVAAGRAEVPPGWKLDRSAPDILLWTTPAGRRHASSLTGDPLPLLRADEGGLG